MKMKAAVVNEFGKPISIEEVTIEPPGGELELRITVGVCHTDLRRQGSMVLLNYRRFLGTSFRLCVKLVKM